MKRSKRIPPVRIRVSDLMTAADVLSDVLTFDSSLKGVGYAADRNGILIMTTDKGYLRVDIEDMETLLEELAYIKDDIKEWKRR